MHCRHDNESEVHLSLAERTSIFPGKQFQLRRVPFIDVIIFIWLINLGTFNTVSSGLVRLSSTSCLGTLNLRRVVNLLPNRVRNILLLCKSWFRMHFDFPINKKPATNSARAFDEEKQERVISSHYRKAMNVRFGVWRWLLRAHMPSAMYRHYAVSVP